MTATEQVTALLVHAATLHVPLRVLELPQDFWVTLMREAHGMRPWDPPILVEGVEQPREPEWGVRKGMERLVFHGPLGTVEIRRGEP